MDLQSFSRREYAVGKMAVVFYRKHPQIDDQVQVRWISDWTEAVDRLRQNPELDAKVRALDSDTDQFLGWLARSLEDMVGFRQKSIPTFPSQRLVAVRSPNR